MKQSIILFALGILGFLTANAQVKIGFTGGIDYSKMNIHREYQDDFGIQGIPGYHFGLASKYQISKSVNLTTDFLFAKKGFSQPTSQVILDKDRLIYNVSDIKVSLYYIEIPVLTEFKVEYEKMNVLFAIGPYISYGIDGNINMDIESASASINYSDKIRWSKSNGMGSDTNESIVDNLGYSQIKRLDYGPIVRFGVEYNSFIVNAEFQYGLANLMWEYRQQERMNNQSLGLSFKYLFNLNKQ